MAKFLPERVKKFIKNYTKTLESQIKVEKVILFGSYAYGKQHRDSDIDLIVLSPDFKKMAFMKRLVWLSKMRGKKFTTRPMDIFGYTSEEFKKLSKESIVLGEAKKEGVIIE